MTCHKLLIVVAVVADAAIAVVILDVAVVVVVRAAFVFNAQCRNIFLYA